MKKTKIQTKAANAAEIAFNEIKQEALSWNAQGGGRTPKTVAASVKLFHRYLKVKQDQWVPASVVAMARDPDVQNLWRKVRLICDRCDGYYVVRHRLDRHYKIAGCSNYRIDDCRSTLGSKEFTKLKAAVIIALLNSQPVPHPYILKAIDSRGKTRARGAQS